MDPNKPTDQNMGAPVDPNAQPTEPVQDANQQSGMQGGVPASVPTEGTTPPQSPTGASMPEPTVTVQEPGQTQAPQEPVAGTVETPSEPGSQPAPDAPTGGNEPTGGQTPPAQGGY